MLSHGEHVKYLIICAQSRVLVKKLPRLGFMCAFVLIRGCSALWQRFRGANVQISVRSSYHPPCRLCAFEATAQHARV